MPFILRTFLLGLALCACEVEVAPPSLVRLDAPHLLVGPRGLLIGPSPEAPSSSAHLVLDDGGQGLSLGPLHAETHLDPIALGLHHGDVITLFSRIAHRDGPSLTFTVDLEGPILISSPPSAPLASLAHLVLELSDHAGLAPLDPALSLGHTLLPNSDYRIAQTSTPTGSTLEIFLGPLPDGVLQISLVPADLLGNIAPETIIRFELDTTPPPLTLFSPQPDALLADSLPLHLVSDSDLVHLDVALTDADGTVHPLDPPVSADTRLEFSLSLVAEGAATLSIIARDALGHRSERTVPLAIDRHPPRLLSLEPTAQTHVRPPFVLTVHATDDVAGLSVLHVPGLPPVPFVNDRASLLLETLPSTPLILEDHAGRTTPVDPRWLLDLSPPSVRFEPPTTTLPFKALDTLELALEDAGCGPDLDATLLTLELTHDGLPQLFSPTVSDVIRLAFVSASGLWQLSVTPVDRCGNTLPRVVGTYLLDFEPPVLGLESLPPYVNGPFTPIFSASEPLATLEYRFPSDPSSTWLPLDTEALPPLTHPDGPLEFAIRAHDLAGNSSISQSVTILDRTPPELFASRPSWVGPNTHLSVSVLDPTSGVDSLTLSDELGILDVSLADGVPSISRDFRLGPLLSRTDTETLSLHLRADDLASNTAEFDLELMRDFRPPTAFSHAPAGLGTALPELVFELADMESGPSPSTSLLEVTRNGFAIDCETSAGPEQLTLRCPDMSGRWHFRLTPEDLVGNVGLPLELSYDVDRTPPDIRFEGASAEGWSGLERAPIDLFVSDDTAVTEVRLVLVDAAQTALEHILTAPPWHADFDLLPLADGELVVRAHARDLAHRETSISKTLAVDNQPPLLKVLPPLVVGPRFDIGLEASDAGSGLDRIEVHSGDQLVGLLELHGASEVASDLAVNLPDSVPHGTVYLEVTAHDLLGRTTTSPTSVHRDALPPTLTTTMPAVLTPSDFIELRFDDPSGIDIEATRNSLSVRLGQIEAIHSVETHAKNILRVRFDPAQSGLGYLMVSAFDLFGNASPSHIQFFRVDTANPTVLRLTPTHGTTQQSPLTTITITFSEALSSPPPSGITLRGTDDFGTRDIPFALTHTGSSLTLTPREPLRSLELISVHFAEGLTDAVGNPLEPPETPPSFSVRSFSFIDVGPTVGLVTQVGGTSEPGENHGPGGLFTDLDNDHFPDLILPVREYRPLNIYRNVAANNPIGRTFAPTRISAARSRGGSGAVAADIDNDGDRDVYLTYWDAPNLLYRNLLSETGRFEFEEATDDTIAPFPNELGLASSTDGTHPLELTMTAAFADVDRDGLLDLYVGHHNGFWNYPQVGLVPGQRNTLYRQSPDGTFRDVTVDANVPGWQLEDGTHITSYQRYSSTNAVIFTDFDDDLWPDLIVTNKTRHPTDHDLLYRNLGVDEQGVWLGFRPINWDFEPLWGDTNILPMGIDVNDLDNDGDLDFYITDWAVIGTVPGPNDIWLNRFVETGRIGFEPLAEATGVYSWGAQLQDFDNNGRVDIHVASNIGEYDLLYMQRPSSSDFGFDFVDEAGLANIRQRKNSRGSMTADIDRDGQVDLVVINLDDAPRVYWNRSDLIHHRPAHWLSIALVGDHDGPLPFRSTRDAIGARILVRADTNGDGIVETLGRQVVSGSSCASSTSSLEVEVGLGSAIVADLEIRWPSGKVTTLEALPVDRHMVIEE